jgi:hypothetical protein
MRFAFAPGILVFLLIALVGMAHAEEFSKAIAPYMLPSETAAGEQFQVNGTTYVLVTVGATPYFLLQETSGNDSFVQNTSTIESVLRARKLDTIGIDARATLIQAKILSFNASRAKEALCKQYVGLIITHPDYNEERPCFYNASDTQPVESCLVACLTVPICHAALGNSLPAIYSILYFKNVTVDMDSNVSALLGEIDGVRALDRAAVERASASMAAVQEAKSRMVQNDLFDNYGFCELIQFDSAALDSAASLLQQTDGDLDYLDGLPAFASNISSLTAQRMKLATKDAAYDVILENATARMALMTTRMSQASHLLQDSFTQGLADSAQLAYVKLTNALKAKDYAAADVAYNEFVVSAENAENAADNLVHRYGSANALLGNCTNSIGRAEELDTQQAYISTTARLRANLSAQHAALAATPMGVGQLATLEVSIKSTCVEVGELMGKLGSDFFAGRRGAVAKNLEEARQLSALYGIGLNETRVQDLLAQADASITIGNFDRSTEFYDAAVAESESLLATAKERGAKVDAAAKAVDAADARLKEADSWKFVFVKPDIAGAKADLDAARPLVKTDPDSAKALAYGAQDKAGSAIGSVETINYALMGGIIMFAMAIGAFVLFKIFKMARRH